MLSVTNVAISDFRAFTASHKIRFLRVVVDYNVDRMQVYRQRCHSRALLIARSLLVFPCMGGIYVQFTGFITGYSLLFYIMSSLFR